MGWANNFSVDGAIAKVERFNHILDERSAWSRAAIAVEEASCPVLLISGQDDQLWPSRRMAGLVMEQLYQSGYRHPYRHIAYPQAGHRIKVPGLARESYEPVSRDTVTNELLQLGGTYEGNKAASQQAWTETVAFLREVNE